MGSGLIHVPVDAEKARFKVERIDCGFRQQQVDTALNQCLGLFVIGIGQLIESNAAIGRVVDLRGDGRLFGGWANRTCHKSGPGRISFRIFVGRSAGTLCCGVIDFSHQLGRQVEFLHAHQACTKRVGFDDVGPRVQIMPVNVGHFVRMGQTENVDEVSKIFVVFGEPLTSYGGLIKLQCLNHRPHRAVQNENTARQDVFKHLHFVGFNCGGHQKILP